MSEKEEEGLPTTRKVETVVAGIDKAELEVAEVKRRGRG